MFLFVSVLLYEIKNVASLVEICKIQQEKNVESHTDLQEFFERESMKITVLDCLKFQF